MTYTFDLKAAYLGLPVKTERKKTLLEIHADGEKKYELSVPDMRDESCDYYCWLRLPDCEGKTLTLEGELTDSFFKQICQADKISYSGLTRPLLHFTADRGWLNDPNGLVYHDGIYHLFFQYNPTDIEWGNMSWGHAVSRDLLCFRQTDTALLPDESGAMFSGNGIVNERGLLGAPKDALVFFYTAAGGINPWSEGKEFTQRIAVSTDGGRTLKKLPGEAVGVIEKDSRDPQVFWHEASGAYVMALWIQGEETALLRSEDLENWVITDRFTLPGAFECPNLFCLPIVDEDFRVLAGGGEEREFAETDCLQWVLTVADGSYYFGSFDGYRFTSDGVRRKNYLTELPYAAQVYSGMENRKVMIPWLRTKNEGRLYTGAMGIPRELGITIRHGISFLSMRPVREYEESRRKIAFVKNVAEHSRQNHSESFAEIFDCGIPVELKNGRISFEINEEAVTELVLRLEKGAELSIEFFGQILTVKKEAIIFGTERTVLPEAFWELHLLIDRQIIEVSGNEYTQTAYYETGADDLTGEIAVAGCVSTLEIYQWKPCAADEGQ
ncbi:MAG: glycoside hydrolase family 32 protein [Lachnospiraceae bacterium]|nr:glycoside hydrolase family 32 protein [Lachnospiraceae bacterium]